MIQQFDHVINDIKKKIFQPIYFLFGDEAYYIDKVADFIEQNALEEHQKAFNQQIVYGKDVEVSQIKDMASRLPMAASHQVIIVKEAQHLKSIESLDSYVKSPNQSTLLVLAYKHKNPDKRKKFYKELINSKNSAAVESKAIRDYEVSKWIANYAKSSKLDISPKGVEMLAEFLGTDISKIVNEIDKLILIKGKGASISEADIEKNIGASKDYNIYEFTKALGERNHEKTFKILQYFEANPKSLVIQLALGAINVFFQKIYLSKFAGNLGDKEFGALLKLHPFIAKDYKKYAQQYNLEQIERIFEMIGEYDLKSKGLGSKSASNSDLLKEMSFKILAI